MSPHIRRIERPARAGHRGRVLSRIRAKSAGLLATVLFLLAACGPGDEPRSTYALGGTVSGLTLGQAVTLRNGSTSLSVSTNGPFSLGDVPSGSAYAVTVVDVPAGSTCSVHNGTGTANADVSDIRVECAPVLNGIGADVSGLTGTGLLLRLTFTANATVTDVEVEANGPVVFPASMSYGTPYSVTVARQPSDQSCVVKNGSGTAENSNVSVNLECVQDTIVFSGCGLWCGDRRPMTLYIGRVSTGQVAVIPHPDFDPAINPAARSVQWSHPSWSPDRKQIMFEEGTGPLGSAVRVCIINRDGSQKTCEPQPASERHYSPEWAPSGNEYVYVTGYQLCIVAGLGGARRCLNPFDTALPGQAVGAVVPRLQSPRWSPDGSTIAFAAYRTVFQDPCGVIYTVDASTLSDIRQVTRPEPGRCHVEPAWAADGKSLAFGDVGSGLDRGAMKIKLDGTGLEPIFPRIGDQASISAGPAPTPGPDSWTFAGSVKDGVAVCDNDMYFRIGGGSISTFSNAIEICDPRWLMLPLK